MFIYKITNLLNGKIYIGYDTGSTLDNNRWNYHLRQYKLDKTKVLYAAMRKYTPDKFKYEIIDDADCIIELCQKEIYYIAAFKSNDVATGYNRTKGGDGGDTFSCRSSKSQQVTRDKISNSNKLRWANIDRDERKELTRHMNLRKWADTTPEDKKKKTAHLHTDIINRKKSEALKEFYNNNPEVAKDKGIAIKQWQDENKDTVVKQNKINSAKAADVNRKKIRVIDPEGNETVYNSKKDFIAEHGHIIARIITKTKAGKKHNGWQGWEIE
jgi:hypothetical protein